MLFQNAENSKAGHSNTTLKHVIKSGSFWLNTDEPLDTIKAQLLVKINNALQHETIQFDNYEVMFCIPCVLPKPGILLANEPDYVYLIEHIIGLKTQDPTVNITISETSTHTDGAGKETKEVAPSRDEQDRVKHKKTQACSFFMMLMMCSSHLRRTAMLPGNVSKNENIQAIWECWICDRPDATCPSTHCYVNPETCEHLPLSHTMIDCWASVMVCSSLYPDHVLFTCTLDHSWKQTRLHLRNHLTINPVTWQMLPSPVLQHCLAQKENAKAGTLSRAPVINFSIGNDIANLFRGIAPGPQPPVLAPPVLPAFIGYNAPCPTLLHPSQCPGDVPISALTTN
jgi:hypothetical protein